MKLAQSLLAAAACCVLFACGNDNHSGVVANDAGTDGGTDAGTDGGTSSSCQIPGSYKNTLSSGAQVSMVVTGSNASGTFTLTIVTSSGTTINIAGNYSLSGNDLTLVNTSSSPSSVQGCIGEAAVYAITWNSACSQITFAKLSDQCSGRIADADGTTITRQ